MIPLSVSEISALDGFCEVQQQDEEELGILVVGWFEEKHPGGIRAWQPKYYDTWYIYVCLGFHTKTQSLFQPCHVCDSRSLDKKDDNKISWSLISWLFWNFQSRSYCQSNYLLENTNLKFSDLFNGKIRHVVFLKWEIFKLPTKQARRCDSYVSPIWNYHPLTWQR